MPGAHRSTGLPMPATDLTALITDSQAVAPLQTPTAQYGATVFRFHTRQKSVLTAARNTFGLPCSLRHWRQPHNIHMPDPDRASSVLIPPEERRKLRNAAQHSTGAAMPRRFWQLYSF